MYRIDERYISHFNDFQKDRKEWNGEKEKKVLETRGSIVEDFFRFRFFSCSSQRSKKIFPFLFFFFSPRQRKTRRTARVNTSVVVQQEAFNQRAWKILFTRSRTPHRSPLYVPICLFTPAHAAPLHARPTFHDRLLDFERVRFSFSPFPFWIGLKFGIFWPIRIDKDYWFDCWSENLFRNSINWRILKRGEKESFFSIDSWKVFLLQIKSCRNFRGRKVW